MDNIERIDRYLSGTMETEEKQAFEAELAKDSQLAKDLTLQRDMNDFLHHKDHRNALQEQIKTIGNNYFKAAQEPKVVQMPRRQMRWIIVASAAAVITLLLVWQFLFSPTLYERYAQYPPLALVEKSANAQVDWSKTEAAFNAGDYASAETQLTQYLVQYPNDQLARLYLGICKMELNKLEEARQIFRSFSTADASLKDYADWYLALSYLKANDKATCQRMLEEISSSSTMYDRAQALLGKLK